MLLGELMTRLSDPAMAEETVLTIGDLSLLAALRERAAAEGSDLGDYAAAAVRRYLNEATDEEWTTLMGLLNRAADPGEACLRRAFAHALERSS